MTNLKFSIVIPNFNQGQFIEEAINSVLDQDYKNFELLIFDGGSTDNSIEIIKKYDKYLTYWESGKDKGQSHAINKGIRKCNGDYFNWLNADDYLEKDCLSKVANQVSNPNQIIIGKLKTFGKIKSQIKQTSLFKGNKAKAIGRVLLAQPAMFFPKSILNIQGQTVNETLQYSFDREWWIKMVLENPTFELKEVNFTISNFRYHDESKTVNSSYKYFYSDNSLIYAELANVIGQNKLANLLIDSCFIKTKTIYKSSFNDEILLSSRTIVKSAINYYLIELGHVLLKYSEIDELRLILKEIDFENLDFFDKRLFITLWVKMNLNRILNNFSLVMI